MPNFAKLDVDRASIVDRAVSELRRAIFDGELPAGTPLREVAISDGLGVARSTVREALSILVAEGVAVREPHRGVTVAVPDPDMVRDVCHARTVLEGAGVARWHEASDTAKDNVRAALRAYLDAIEHDESYAAMNARHLDFHLSLVGLTESPRLVKMASAVIGELKVALAHVDRVRRNAHDQAQSHADLLAILESGDVDAAAAGIRTHLDLAEESILAALDL